MVIDGVDIGGVVIYVWFGDFLWEYCEKEVGSEFGFYGVICVCCDVFVLGDMGL